MSEPREEKIYVPFSSAKEIKFQSGHSIIKLGFKVEELKKFLNRHTNERGYINIGISKRQEVGQFGDTHCVWLDTYKPKQSGQHPDGARRMTREEVHKGLQEAADDLANNPPRDKDVPF
jgi:hypothetical protein